MIDIKECEKCNYFFIGGEMGGIHNKYPMCEKAHRNIVWNMKKCPMELQEKNK